MQCCTYVRTTSQINARPDHGNADDSSTGEGDSPAAALTQPPATMGGDKDEIDAVEGGSYVCHPVPIAPGDVTSSKSDKSEIQSEDTNAAVRPLLPAQI